MPENSNDLPDFPSIDWRECVDALATQGFACLPAALPESAWMALRREAQQLRENAVFAPARIGRGDGLHREATVRGDESCWLTTDLPAAARYLAWTEELRLTLNRELFLGLQEFEAHYARYPVGAFYKKHVDRHYDSNARVVSTVFYLNAQWPTEAGGELVMYGKEGMPLFTQKPEGGTLLLFLSQDMPHEVLPATCERWSIAGWFRRGE